MGLLEILLNTHDGHATLFEFTRFIFFTIQVNTVGPAVFTSSLSRYHGTTAVYIVVVTVYIVTTNRYRSNVTVFLVSITRYTIILTTNLRKTEGLIFFRQSKGIVRISQSTIIQ